MPRKKQETATPKPEATAKKPRSSAKKPTAKKPTAKKKPAAATPKTKTTAKKPRPVSPINGQPLPQGKVIQAGEEARELGRKGGKKSAEVRRARKTLRDELLDLLIVDITDKNGKLMKTQTAISASMIKQALTGNTKAYEIIRDTIGEKPIDKVLVAEVDKATIDEVEAIVLGDSKDANTAASN